VTEAAPLVEVRDLVKHFPIAGGVFHRTQGMVQAVDGVSFEVQRGETLGLVGESGCGKTTVGRLLLRLIEPTSGTIRFDGQDITKLKGSELKRYRRRIQIIFQDPYASLDPRTPIGDSIGEGLRIHGIGTPTERRAKVARMMDMVGLQVVNRPPYTVGSWVGNPAAAVVVSGIAASPSIICVLISIRKSTSSLPVMFWSISRMTACPIEMIWARKGAGRRF